MTAMSPRAGFDPPIRASTDFDMLIVGAGISGIGMAVHLGKAFSDKGGPGKTYAVLERRADLGGTWDLFRYPGIRSDSDMHTLGFVFEPWKHEKSIADGPAILEYLNRIVDERGIRPNIRFDSKVISADFDHATARWSVTTEASDGTRTVQTANFLFLGSGYYDYDQPYDAQFPGREEFKGAVVHPQFWPRDLDYRGKKVVVIGSGATAATIVPALVAGGATVAAEHVTMLQRTPTWYASRPAKDRFANTLRKWLPETWAYAITRFRNVRMQDWVFKMARTKPERVKAALTKAAMDQLGDKYDAEAFTPPYNPWDQRLCLIPDGDLFEAIKADKAAIVTDKIERFDASGIVLASGRHLDADLIVTATGLKLAVAGKIAVSVDGEPVDFAQRYYYNNAMFSNLPNLAVVFGYLNASWTLRSDIVAQYVCRVIGHMDKTGTTIATPVLGPDERIEDDNIFDFSSGYLQRSLHELPKSAKTLPWRLNQEYLHDRRNMRTAPIADGVLRFTTASPREPVEAPNEGLLEAAE